MYFSKHLLLAATAVLVVLAEYSNASLTNRVAQDQTIGSIAGDKVCAELRNQFNEAELLLSVGKATRVAWNQASDAKIISRNNEAIDITLKGLTGGFKALVEAENAVLDSLKNACIIFSNDEAIKVIEDGYEKAINKILLGEGGMCLAVGAATQLSQDGAKQGLNDAIQIGSDYFQVLYDGLGAAKSLAIQGIKAGRNAKNQALMASLKGMQSALKNILQTQIWSIKKAFDAIKNEALQVNESSEIDLAGEKAANNSVPCQAAIKTINRLAVQGERSLATGLKLQAINEVRNGLVMVCKSYAVAAQTSNLAMDTAREILNQDAAITTIKIAIADSKKACHIGASIGHQVLGAAAQIMGKPAVRNGLLYAMSIVETSRNEMFKGLESSSILSTQGIHFNEPENGLTAGREGVASAFSTGLAIILKAADFAFQQILST